jgi:hypothetical protein
MLQPVELRITLPMELRGGQWATTTDVWHMLAATCPKGRRGGGDDHPGSHNGHSVNLDPR